MGAERKLGGYSKLHEQPPPLRGPKVPLKELSLAIFLFVIGVSFMLIGANTFFRTTLSESVPLIALGLLCFIPGAYHSFIFLMIFRKVPGYSYDLISTLNSR